MTSSTTFWGSAIPSAKKYASTACPIRDRRGGTPGKTLGQSQDNFVGVPSQHLSGRVRHATTRHHLRQSRRASAKSWSAASDQMRAILRARRHDAPGQEDSFSIDTNASFVGLFKSFSQSFFGVPSESRPYRW